MNRLIAIILCLQILAAFPLLAHAEEPEDTPDWAETVDSTPKTAEDSARVPVEIDPDQLAKAITQALATPEPDPNATPEPEQPEPTPQVIVIQQTPETAATPAPTTAPTIWDKPFDDYTPTEGLLLVIFVALCFLSLLIWLR